MQGCSPGIGGFNWRLDVETKPGIISKAIEQKCFLKFKYKGHERIVEPYILGKTANNAFSLNAYFVSGYSGSKSELPWRYYNLDKISNLHIQDETFSQAQPGYNPRDPKFSIIYCYYED